VRWDCHGLVEVKQGDVCFSWLVAVSSIAASVEDELAGSIDRRELTLTNLRVLETICIHGLQEAPWIESRFFPCFPETSKKRC
jgi:hypothetical protein